MKQEQWMSTILDSFRVVVMICLTILFYALIVAGIVRACHASYEFCYEVFGSEPMRIPGEEVSFTVENEDSMSKVAARLEHRGLIQSRYSFYFRTRLMDPKKVKLQSGTYILSTDMNYEEIINQLTVSGQRSLGNGE